MQTYIKKFNEITHYYNISDARLVDLAGAICVADILNGTNEKKLSLKRLANSGVVAFKSLDSRTSEPLPDVQVMRVMCDTLYYALLIKGINVKDTHLTNEASDIVGRNIKRSDKVLEIKSGSYSDLSECERILDAFYNSMMLISADEANDIKEFINFISRNFKEKCSFSHLVVDLAYKDLLRGSYFFENITFKSTGDKFLETVTTYLLDNYKSNSNILETALTITTKGRHLELPEKLVLPVSSKDLQTIRGSSLIYNSLGSVFTFINNKDTQNVKSLSALYTVLYATMSEIEGGSLNVSFR